MNESPYRPYERRSRGSPSRQEPAYPITSRTLSSPNATKDAASRLKLRVKPSTQEAPIKKSLFSQFASLRRERNHSVTDSFLDDARMERRFQKLVEVIFPDILGLEPESSTSTFLDFLASDDKPNKEHIVKWRDSKQVDRCMRCHVPFSLIVRKHHCRLCGDVFCNLPRDTDGVYKRTERCICNVTCLPYPWDHDKETVHEKESDSSIFSKCVAVIVPEDADIELSELLGDKPGPNRHFPAVVKVRICASCKTQLLTLQQRLAPARYPGWFKTYENMRQSKVELDKIISATRESISSAQSALSEAHSVGPSLRYLDKLDQDFIVWLKRFNDFSKLIVQILCKMPPGTIEFKLGSGLGQTAQSFANESLVTLQTLEGLVDKIRYLQRSEQPSVPSENARSREAAPKSSLRTPGSKSTSSNHVRFENQPPTPALAVLLEQERQLLAFIGEAVSQRRLQDVSTLMGNLNEVRSEIASGELL